MIKVVIDTNVVVSASLVGQGPSAAILNLATHQRIQMFVSAAVLAEYEEVLRRPRLKLDPTRIADVLALVRSTSTQVSLLRRSRFPTTNPTIVFTNVPKPPKLTISSPATPRISAGTTRP